MIDRQPPRLSVGIISAGAVGLALAEAFTRAGHHVHGIHAHSERSRARAAQRAPGIPIVSLAEAAMAQLVVLAVPDPVLPEVAAEVARTVRDGQMVMHTSGRNGCQVLQSITDEGALPLALHPAMGFVGTQQDTENLLGCGWGVTTDSEVGQAVGELLVQSLGGVAVHIAEDRRPAYHAAMAHAANHLVTVISDAHSMLNAVLDKPNDPAVIEGEGESSEARLLLNSIVRAGADATLCEHLGALTGPASRDDAPAVLAHLEALRQLSENSADPNSHDLHLRYLPMAERTAQAAGSPEVERALMAYRSEHGLPGGLT